MSINDPRWGNQNNDQDRDKGQRDNEQGPPDLEAVWRDFNQKLGGLFGGRGNGSGGNGRSNPGRAGGGLPPKFLGNAVIALFFVAVFVWLVSGFYSVDANQNGVVLRFGKFVTLTEPGLRWRLPYPIESHELVDRTGVRVVELREALMLTDDENIVNIQFAVQYLLKNPVDYVFKTRDPEESVLQAAETAMREIVGKRKMDFVLYEGRADIATMAQTQMQEILDSYQTGIQISRVTLQNAQPPEQVQAAFDDAVKAGQDRERQINEGNAYYNDVVPRAEGAVARLKEEAHAYAGRVVANAEGESDRFNNILISYRQAPGVTRERLYLETLQEVLSSTSKIMIDAESNSNLLLLPLDKLMQTTEKPQAKSTELPPPQNASIPLTVIPSTTSANTRDLSRNRERGF